MDSTRHLQRAKQINLFQDILQQNKEKAAEFLLGIQWILYAKRPLKPEEFYCAVLAGTQLHRVDWGSDLKQSAAGGLHNFVHGCSNGLAEVTKSNPPVVRFIHENVREFLLNDGGIRVVWPHLAANFQSRSHDQLKQCCYIHLQRHKHIPRNQGFAETRSHKAEVLPSTGSPFLEYATHHVLYHANIAAFHFPQRDFLESFDVRAWNSFRALFGAFGTHYTLSTNLLYILAESNYPLLIDDRMRYNATSYVKEELEYPLIVALTSGHRDAAKALLRSQLGLVNPSIISADLLLWATRRGYRELVQLLANKGAGLEAKDIGGYTPLLRAIRNGHQEIAQFLVKKGADIEAKDCAGQTPLWLAMINGHHNTVRLLVSKGADLELKDSFGNAPLLWATLHGHRNTVELLVKRGVDLETKDSCVGNTPLFWAIRIGDQNIVRLLVEKGANLEAKDRLGNTPLSWAICHGHHGITRLLIEKGANLESRDNFGDTPLWLALLNGQYHIVQLLVESGANTRSKDYFGNTPLSWAVQNGHQTIVQLLVERGADEPYQSASAFLGEVETTYSGIRNGLTPNEDLLNGLAKILLRDAGLESLSSLARGRALGILPELLRSFAERLANESSARVHRDAAMLIRECRFIISSNFTQRHRSGSQNPAGSGNSPKREKSALNSALENCAAITVPKLLTKRQGGIAEAIDHEILDAKDSERRKLMKEADKCANRGSKSETVQTLRYYEEMILGSLAHSWLLSSLKKEANLITAEPNVINAIRDFVLLCLPLSRILSRANSLLNFGVRFDIDWDPLSFLVKQFEGRTHDILGSTLTLTGSFHNAQAVTCMDYMRQTWPSSGEHTVRLLNEALSKPSTWNKCKLPDDTTLFANILKSKLTVVVIGTRDAIAEIGEQLSWITAALRLAPNDQGVYRCKPSVQPVRFGEHWADVPGVLQPLDASFVVSCRILGPPTERNLTGQCWHGLFKNPTIVQGYPIPRRAREGTGLEIPLGILADLVQAPQISTFREKVFLKGFSSMLVLMDQMEDSTIWHLNLNRDGSYISHINASESPISGAMDVENTIENAMKSRHIVGWCLKANFYIGTDKAPYPVKKPALDTPNDECVLYKIKPSRVKAIEKKQGYYRADKDEPTYMHYGEGLHRRRLERLKDKYMNLWDVESERGWLVNGVGAWLHLLRARLKHVSEDDNCGLELKETPISHRYTIRSSLEFFRNRENMNLAVYPNEYQGEERLFTVMDQSNRLYSTLDNLIELQEEALRLRVSASRKWLSGWAFRDLATEKEQFEPYAIMLPEMGRSWVDFIRAISTVTLFGRGFGELIRPDNACEEWADLPRGKFFLATSGQVVRRIMDDVGNSPGQPWKLGRDIVWHNPTKPCECSRKEGNHADNIQVLLPAKVSEENGPEVGYEEPEDNSAFILGVNPNSSWCWQEFGPPIKTNPPPSPENFEDSMPMGSDIRYDGPGMSESPPVSAKMYTVGILCTLREEGAAMKTLFDQIHGEPDNYVLGSIGNHNVVLAYLPLEPGIAAASAAATQLATDFPGIKFGLLVGIAGGVPSETADIRLGDVVVGVPKDAYPGVIQLGRGKDLEHNGFQRTGSLNRPPRFLLSAIASMTADSQCCSIQLHDLVQSVAESKPKYQRPDQQLDVWDLAPCDQCVDICTDRGNHIEGKELRRPDCPVIHCGLIGSSDKVIKDRQKRDALAKQYGVLCVEMEAAGALHSDIPFLVIRGISDYADSHKNDQWHSYASLTAAGFAKMLLCKVTGPDSASVHNPRAAKRKLLHHNSPPRSTRRRLDNGS
ncbi:hypothetical protein O1611_g6957 [Lasiodiplodia mahajangana]|uniref:Uncharacterized protein n=1 Tax=Lasiodiplodia mahajangana TaxID=1108764 RepID=A0ACC2JGV7_9PEZI|nr:hypothetical protein O1611_g6957 [Lasiodiplodia mahajangana]